MNFTLYCSFAIGLAYDAVAGAYLVHLWKEPRQHGVQAAKPTLEASEAARKTAPAATATRLYRFH